MGNYFRRFTRERRHRMIGFNAKRALLASMGMAVAATLIVGIFSLTPLYRNMDYAIGDDATRRFTHAGLADEQVVILAIDDAAIRNFSKIYNVNWPWPREFYGLVTNYLQRAGAKSVIFDMLFTEKEVDRMDVSADASERAFADAIARSGRVVLGGVVANGPLEMSLRTAGGLTFPGSETIPAPVYDSLTPPIASLAHNATTGVVNFMADSDGTVRRMPLFFKVGDALYPQLAFAAYLTGTGDKVVRYLPESRKLVTEKNLFSLDDEGRHTIFWYGPGGAEGVYRYDSFYDALRSVVAEMEGEAPVIPKSEYKDKHVVVCGTASGLMDLKSTPFTPLAPYPGGEIQATLLDNYLNGRHVRRVEGVSVVLFSLVAALTAAFAFAAGSFTVAAGVSSSLLLFVLGIGWLLLRQGGLSVDLLFPLLTLGLTAMGAAIYRMVTEGAAKRQIRAIFSRYLHEDVINHLMRHPDTVSLEGTECVGTVLFTDLQGFTSFAEDKTPKELIGVLNRYFDVVTGIVLEQGGMLDKYTGDGIMAVFGAPVSRDDHVRAACEAVLEFRRRKVNRLIPSEQGDILTRIGISAGPVVVGNLGSERRMDFTAIGDTVNLSARLEGVNKAYGTTNMLCENAWNEVKEAYLFREVDCIRVKGKNRPIRVFTLIERLGDVTPEMQAVEDAFSEALLIYRTRDWDRAVACFEKVLALDPEDGPAAAYIKRCQLLKKNPALVGDDGVFNFQTK